MTFEEQMRNDGWKNTYDEHPKVAGEYLVQDHNGNRFKAMYYINEFGTRVWKGDKGYDICWWNERRDHGTIKRRNTQYQQ